MTWTGRLFQGPADDPFNRPPSGGPVKRNDAEYRWVTDATKFEYREVVDFPCVSERVSTRPSPLGTQPLSHARFRVPHLSHRLECHLWREP